MHRMGSMRLKTCKMPVIYVWLGLQISFLCLEFFEIWRQWGGNRLIFRQNLNKNQRIALNSMPCSRCTVITKRLIMGFDKKARNRSQVQGQCVKTCLWPLQSRSNEEFYIPWICYLVSSYSATAFNISTLKTPPRRFFSLPSVPL